MTVGLVFIEYHIKALKNVNNKKKDNKVYMNTKINQNKHFFNSKFQKIANLEGRMVTGSIGHRSKWS